MVSSTSKKVLAEDEPQVYVSVPQFCQKHSLIKPTYSFVKRESVTGKVTWYATASHPGLRERVLAQAQSKDSALRELEEKLLEDPEKLFSGLIEPHSVLRDERIFLEEVKIVVAEDQKTLSVWISRYVNPKRMSPLEGLGFDSEFGSVSSKGCIGIFQLFVPGRCLIFRAPPPDKKGVQKLPEDLEELLKSGVKKYCFDPREDVKLLKENCGIEAGGVVDIRSLISPSTGYSRHSGLAKMVKVFLGVKLKKDLKVRTSNWAVWPLSKEQIRYAAIDAAASYALSFRLVEINRSVGTGL